jgi:hypothetical protein
MILPALTGISLLLMTAGAPTGDLDGPARRPAGLQQNTAVQLSITRATECVARTVAADPRSADAGNLGDLIVDSMSSCVDAMHTMIDTYDQAFGDGKGEAFFSGPYLDVLPTAVSKWVAEGKHKAEQ